MDTNDPSPEPALRSVAIAVASVVAGIITLAAFLTWATAKARNNGTPRSTSTVTTETTSPPTTTTTVPSIERPARRLHLDRFMYVTCSGGPLTVESSASDGRALSTQLVADCDQAMDAIETGDGPIIPAPSGTTGTS